MNCNDLLTKIDELPLEGMAEIRQNLINIRKVEGGNAEVHDSTEILDMLNSFHGDLVDHPHS